MRPVWVALVYSAKRRGAPAGEHVLGQVEPARAGREVGEGVGVELVERC